MGHGMEAFSAKKIGKIEQKLIQIELSQRWVFRPVSTTGTHLDRKKAVHLPASNTSCPQERQLLS